MIKNYPNQRFVWKHDISKPVKTQELTTVTYCTVCAPYLGTINLQMLSIDDGKYFPMAAPELRSDFYMEDSLKPVHIP